MKRTLFPILILALVLSQLAAIAATVAVKVQNKTGAALAISFSGSATYYFQLTTGKNTVQMTPGTYQYSYEACGTTNSGRLKVGPSGASLVLKKCQQGGGGKCHPSYPTVCIPSPPPDLDCDDITFRRFKVKGKDPHNFDGDHDGIGCEI